MAQGSAQVVRDRIAEGFEFFIGSFELRGPLKQLGVLLSQCLLGERQLGRALFHALIQFHGEQKDLPVGLREFVLQKPDEFLGAAGGWLRNFGNHRLEFLATRTVASSSFLPSWLSRRRAITAGRSCASSLK